MNAASQSEPDHLSAISGPTFVVLSLRVERRDNRVLITGRTREGKQVTLSIDAATALLDCLVAAEMGRLILSDAGVDRHAVCAALIHKQEDPCHEPLNFRSMSAQRDNQSS